MSLWPPLDGEQLWTRGGGGVSREALWRLCRQGLGTDVPSARDITGGQGGESCRDSDRHQEGIQREEGVCFLAWRLGGGWMRREA